MYKKLLLISSITASLSAQDFLISPNYWHFIGTTSNINLNTLNLKNNDTIWTYKTNRWYCYKKNVDISSKCNQVETLEAGDAFWLLSNNSYTLSLNLVKEKEKTLNGGWNMFTPVIKENTLSNYNEDNTLSLWKYKEAEWYLWTPKNINTSLKTFSSISIGEGVWINKIGDLTFSNISTDINNGNFNKLNVKYQTDDFSTFKLKIKIDTNNIPSEKFDIGIKMNSVEFLLKDILITNNSISQPSHIYAQKGTNTKGITKYDIVSLKNGYITINLEDTYNQLKVVAPDYKPAMGDKETIIISDKLIFSNDKKNTTEIQIAKNNFTSVVYGDDSHKFTLNSSLLEGVIHLY